MLSFERIRWDLADAGRMIRIGNNHRPFYARRFMKKYPKHEGFFLTRSQFSAKKGRIGEHMHGGPSQFEEPA